MTPSRPVRYFVPFAIQGFSEAIRDVVLRRDPCVQVACRHTECAVLRAVTEWLATEGRYWCDREADEMESASSPS